MAKEFPGKNSLCLCGSGKKYKHCCWLKREGQQPAVAMRLGSPRFTAAYWMILDYLVVPAGIVWLSFEPNYAHGFIDYFEAGQYLAPINGIFHGEIPYRDSYTAFGPLFLYVPAACMALFGKTLATLIAYFHFAWIFSMVVVYLVGCLACRTRLFRYAIPLVTLVEVFHPFWSSRWGAARVGVGLAMLAGLIQYVRTGNARILLWAGIVSGLGLLYSTELGVLSVVSAGALVLWMLLHRQRTIRGVLRDGWWYMGGVLCILLPFGMYFASKGALIPYLRTALWDMPVHHMSVWAQPNTRSFLVEFREASNLFVFLQGDTFKIYLPALLYGVAAVYLVVRWIRRQVTQETTTVWLLVVYGFVLYLMAFRGIDGPQFQMALPPLILLMAFLLEQRAIAVRETIRVALSARGLSVVKAATVVLSMLTLVVSVWYVMGSEKRYYWSLQGWCRYQQHKPALTALYMGPQWMAQADLVPMRSERSGEVLVPRSQAEDLDGVTTFLRSVTQPGEVVFAFPEHGIFNFLADRPGVSRFDIAGLAWTTPEWRRELFDELKAHPPRFVVVGKSLSNLARCIRRKQELLPEIGEYLTSHYRRVKDFSTVAVLEYTEEKRGVRSAVGLTVE